MSWKIRRFEFICASVEDSSSCAFHPFLCRISDYQLHKKFYFASQQLLSAQPNRPSSIMNFFIFAIFCSIAAFAFAQQDTLQPGGQFDGERGVPCPSTRYFLTVQDDGNMVLKDRWRKYDFTNMRDWVWSTNTAGSGATKAIMQTDGEFTLQTASGKTVWRTYTKDAGSWLKVQDDGNIVLHSPNGYPVWNAKTGWGMKTTV